MLPGSNSNAPAIPCRPNRTVRIVATLAAIGLGIWMLWSGTMCVLWALEIEIGGKNAYHYSSWPWNRAWFMFSWNDGYSHRLEVLGHLENGDTVTIDSSRWFQFQVARDSQRCHEIPRDPASLSSFARHVADRYNETRAPGERAVRVSVQDVWWKNAPGQRRAHTEVPRLERTQRQIVERIECRPRTDSPPMP